MNKYFEFLDSIPEANELNAPNFLVEEFGIEYRIAVDVSTDWVRLVKSRSEYADKPNQGI